MGLTAKLHLKELRLLKLLVTGFNKGLVMENLPWILRTPHENQANERVQINEIHKIKMEIPCYRDK